jgi:hypothetical protein
VWWSGAAAAPILIHAVLVLASVQGGGLLPHYVRTQVNVEALLAESMAVVIAGPILGVFAATRAARLASSPKNIAQRLAVGAAIFALAAAAASLVVARSGDAGALVASHVTLAIAALTVSSMGAAAGLYFDHPLDATACALAVSLTAGCGVLVTGPLVDAAPLAIVNSALLASPIVATASAADIDVLRGDLLYRFSPIAHSQFAYPAWQLACGTYAVVAAACFAFIVALSNRGRRMISAERISV